MGPAWKPPGGTCPGPPSAVENAPRRPRPVLPTGVITSSSCGPPPRARSAAASAPWFPRPGPVRVAGGSPNRGCSAHSGGHSEVIRLASGPGSSARSSTGTAYQGSYDTLVSHALLEVRAAGLSPSAANRSSISSLVRSDRCRRGPCAAPCVRGEVGGSRTEAWTGRGTLTSFTSGWSASTSSCSACRTRCPRANSMATSRLLTSTGSAQSGGRIRIQEDADATSPRTASTSTTASHWWNSPESELGHPSSGSARLVPAGTRNKIWLGREDSNPRLPDPESGALPAWPRPSIGQGTCTRHHGAAAALYRCHCGALRRFVADGQ
jgi:hypothetical protein